MSISFLLLVFSGAVDLGRAYFSWIQVQSAASEGAQWAAAYPACIPNDTNNQSGGPLRCQGSNSIFERILNEDRLLNRNDYLCIQAMVTPSGHALAPQRGDDVEIKTKFQIRLITPVMRGLFGDTLAIYGDDHETIINLAGVLPPQDPAVSLQAESDGVTVGCTIP